MNKKIARKLIKELLVELNAKNIKEQFWMDKVYAYTQAIFGDEKQSIALPMFNTYYYNRPYSAWTDEQSIAIVGRLKVLFQSFLVMVDNGIFLRKNLFSRYGDSATIGIIISIILSAGSIGAWNGYNWGLKIYECRNVKLENDQQALKDSLSFFHKEIDSYKYPVHPVVVDTSKKASK